MEMVQNFKIDISVIFYYDYVKNLAFYFLLR